MANTKISNLPAAASLFGSDLMPVVQGGVTKKGTFDQIPFLQAGTGAVARTAQAKMRDVVSVKDFGAAGDGVTDDTAAFVAAQAASKNIQVPPGTYVLDNLRIQNQVCIRGSGYESTVFKQKTAGNYAINCLSDPAVGQLLGVELSGFRFEGATSATVAALNIEANGFYAITHSIFNFSAKNTYSPLRMNCPTAGAVYNCDIRVTSDASQAGIVSEGTYNRYDFFITGVASGLYVQDISASCFFSRLVTEGMVRIDGSGCVFAMLVVENFNGSAQSTVVRVGGAGHTFNNVLLVTIPNAKVTNESGVEIYGANVALDRVQFSGGTFPTGAPRYPIFVSDTSSGRIANFDRGGTQLTLDSYTQGAYLRKWTFAGDVSTLISAPVTRDGKYIHINTTATAGSTVTFGANSTVNDWFDVFVLNIAGTLATLTITIPQNPVNGQAATFCSSGAGGVTTLTLSPGAGKSIVGAPTGLASGTSFTLVYRSSDSTWYRVM